MRIADVIEIISNIKDVYGNLEVRLYGSTVVDISVQKERVESKDKVAHFVELK